ncbi:MAG TPA: tail fiber domain-containing protein [Moheibacter sp.]|nr:tail fiber domain-containing protein [Moheibacter sp.]
MKKNVLILFTFIGASLVYSQVGIGTENPNPDALLEIDATTQQGGLLLPRVALVSTTAAAPLTAHVQGMVLYNTATTTGENSVSPGYYYNDGSQWVQINAADGGGSASGTAWSMQGNAGTDAATDFIGTTDTQPLVFKVNNTRTGFLDHRKNGNLFLGLEAGNMTTTGTRNIGIGEGVLKLNTTGVANTGFGIFTLSSNLTGRSNAAFGSAVLFQNTTGSQNAGFGASVLSQNTTGSNNSGFGYVSLYSNTIGSFNTGFGYETLYSNTVGSFNAALGARALRLNTTGEYNSAFGNQALYSNTTGSNNAGFGAYVLHKNTIGENNSGFGYEALYSNTSGSYNVAFGLAALRSNSTGRFNVGFGASSLYSNTIGISNSGFGNEVLYSNTTGSYNAGFGATSLSNNTTGGYNTGLGNRALFSNTTGSNNVGVGYRALSTNITGSYNTGVGFSADVAFDNLNNATAIGYDAKVNASNKVRIGNSEVTVIEGQVPFTTPSDARFKSNVQHNVPGLAFINQLQPVTYYFDNQKMGQQLKEKSTDLKKTASKKIQTGFLAQDVEKAAQALNYSFDGVHAPENSDDYYTLSYSQFVVPLVQAVKEQQEMIEAQQALIKDLQNEMAEMKSQLNP